MDKISPTKFDFSKIPPLFVLQSNIFQVGQMEFQNTIFEMAHPIDGDSIIISFQEGQTTFYNVFLTMLLFSLVIGL